MPENLPTSRATEKSLESPLDKEPQVIREHARDDVLRRIYDAQEQELLVMNAIMDADLSQEQRREIRRVFFDMSFTWRSLARELAGVNAGEWEQYVIQHQDGTR